VTTLQLLAASESVVILGLLALADQVGGPCLASAFDNQPTWDNKNGGGFDNRPTWDNWSKR
jgi:hypothetical protein